MENAVCRHGICGNWLVGEIHDTTASPGSLLRDPKKRFRLVDDDAKCFRQFTGWNADGGKTLQATLATGVFAFLLTASAWAADESLQIRLNTVGYLPQAKKQASIAAACTNFTVIRVADGATVFNGKITGPVLNPDTQEQLYTADFSKVKQPGDYQLDVPGVGRSAPFRIATDVYREPYYAAMRGFYLWRCGTAVSATYHGETFAHAACHTNDAWLDYVGGGHTQQGRHERLARRG